MMAVVLVGPGGKMIGFGGLIEEQALTGKQVTKGPDAVNRV